MADAVTTNVVFAGTRRRIIQLINISDATGESDVVKVDASALTGPDGTAPTSVTVDAIDYNIQGFSSVVLEWDATTDNVIAVLPAGSGTLDFTYGGGIHDPKSTGTTGDILLTTVGASATATYDITLYLRLED